MKHETDSVRPPNIAVWLINLFASAENTEALLGDMLEEFSESASKLGSVFARRWFWRQTVKTIPHLLVSGFRAAPWSTAAVVLGGFLLMRFVSRLPEMAIFAVLTRYRVFERHFNVYVFLATYGIAIGHVIASTFVGLTVALIAKRREMAATVTLALVFCSLIAISYFAWIAQHWPIEEAMTWLLWQCADPIAIVVAGAIVRTRRSGAKTLPSTT